jgi:flagellar basal-body rod protein FlgG
MLLQYGNIGSGIMLIKGIQKIATSMVPRLRLQEVVANNMANAETAGFKKDSIFLRYVKEQQGLNGKLTPSWETRMINKLYTDYTEGALDPTGRDLDFAIQGDGFFAVQTPNGEAYTRNGSFSLSPSGQLVTSDNYPVLTDGGPLTVQGGKLTITSTGQVYVDNAMLGTLKVVDFAKPYQLQKVNGSLYKAPNSVSPTQANPVVVRQGYLEKSNVDVLREMVDMIDSYRTFETGQRMIQIQDESLGKAVNDLPRKA